MLSVTFFCPENIGVLSSNVFYRDIEDGWMLFLLAVIHLILNMLGVGIVLESDKSLVLVLSVIH